MNSEEQFSNSTYADQMHGVCGAAGGMKPP
jgi:hypothetical protein